MQPIQARIRAPGAPSRWVAPATHCAVLHHPSRPRVASLQILEEGASSPRIRAALLLALVSCASSACVVHTPYPTSWPQQEARGAIACADVAGTYSNPGVRFWSKDETKPDPSPFERILGYPEGMWRAQKFTISTPSPGVVEVVLDEHPAPVVEGENVPFLRKVLREGKDYQCEKQGLTISHSEADKSDPAGQFHVSITTHFQRGTDGSLIGKSEFQAIGVLFSIFPVASKGNFWERFQLCNECTAATQSIPRDPP